MGLLRNSRQSDTGSPHRQLLPDALVFVREIIQGPTSTVPLVCHRVPDFKNTLPEIVIAGRPIVEGSSSTSNNSNNSKSMESGNGQEDDERDGAYAYHFWYLANTWLIVVSNSPSIKESNEGKGLSENFYPERHRET